MTEYYKLEIEYKKKEIVELKEKRAKLQDKIDKLDKLDNKQNKYKLDDYKSEIDMYNDEIEELEQEIIHIKKTSLNANNFKKDKSKSTTKPTSKSTLKSTAKSTLKSTSKSTSKSTAKSKPDNVTLQNKKSNSYNLGDTYAERVLALYSRLIKGEVIYKDKFAREVGRNEKTIRRYFKAINLYLERKNSKSVVKYDDNYKGYYLERNEEEWLTKGEVLSVIKVLFESRAFAKKELNSVIDKLLQQTEKKDRKLIENVIVSEKKYYDPVLCNRNVKASKNIIKQVWELTNYARKKQVIQIGYRKPNLDLDNKKIIDPKATTDTVDLEYYFVQPMSVMFSEFYFYLIANKITPGQNGDKDKTESRTYRIDRIKNITDLKDTESTKSTKIKFNLGLDKTFNFSDGEFRKKMFFMFTSDETYKVKFNYKGHLEPIIDRFPNSKIKLATDLYNVEAIKPSDNKYNSMLNDLGDNITNLTATSQLVSVNNNKANNHQDLKFTYKGDVNELDAYCKITKRELIQDTYELTTTVNGPGYEFWLKSYDDNVSYIEDPKKIKIKTKK